MAPRGSRSIFLHILTPESLSKVRPRIESTAYSAQRVCKVAGYFIGERNDTPKRNRFGNPSPAQARVSSARRRYCLISIRTSLSSRTRCINNNTTRMPSYPRRPKEDLRSYRIEAETNREASPGRRAFHLPFRVPAPPRPRSVWNRCIVVHGEYFTPRAVSRATEIISSRDSRTMRAADAQREGNPRDKSRI